MVLGRTQPAITQAVRRLESAVGFALLDRSGYRARLTERGELFVKRARSAVGQAKDLRTFAMLLAQGVEHRVRIACHGAIPAEQLISLVDGVAAEFPDTVLELEFGEGQAPLRRLLEGEAQLALVLHELPDRHGTTIERKRLGSVDFVNIVRTDRLDQLQEEFPSLPQILVADFDDPASSYGVVEGGRHCRVSNHRVKAAMIVAGQGWGSVPEALVTAELEQGILNPIAHKGLGERGRRSFSICRRREQVHGPVTRRIWNSAQMITD